MKKKRWLLSKGSQSVRHKLTSRTTVLIFSFVALVIGAIAFLLSLSDSKEAFAATCSSSYAVDWNDPNTFTVSCGTVNSSSWTVKNDSCSYNSPVLPVGGTAGNPNRLVDLSVRVNQSGNLTINDFCWIYFYINGSISSSYIARGDTIANAVFYIPVTLSVPAGGTYQIVVRFKNDRTNEFWEVKKGDIISCVQSPATPLPVTLTSFTGTVTTEGTRLKWTTASEVNNDHFIVSRSFDAVNFKEISQIPGCGTTSTRHDYLVVDDQTPSGISYYRLSQTDYDGTTSIFGPISVNNNSFGKSHLKASVFPNPFNDRFKTTFTSPSNQAVSVSIFSLNGTLLEENEFTAKKGLNRLEIFPDQSLPQGMYLVRILTESGDVQILKILHK